jgi:glucokinase
MVAHDLVMLTIGTGAGGGLVLGGRIYRGAAGGAGELGHTIVGLEAWDRAVPAPTAFPQPGSLESFAACGRSTGLLRRPPSVIRRRRSAACGRAAGPSSAGPRWGASCCCSRPRAWRRSYVLPGLGTRTVIRLPRHGVRGGVLGAALLAIHEVGEV